MQQRIQTIESETEFIEYGCNNCQGGGCPVCSGSGVIRMPKLSDKIGHISFPSAPDAETILAVNQMVELAFHNTSKNKKA